MSATAFWKLLPKSEGLETKRKTVAIRSSNYVGVAIALFNLSCPVFSQPTSAMPQDYDYSRITEVLLDAGYGWERNSYFHPIDPFSAPSVRSNPSSPAVNLLSALASPDCLRFYSSNDSAGLLELFGWSGIDFRYQLGKNKEFEGLSLSPFIQGYASFRQNWFTRFAVRSTNKEASLDHFSGVTRDISRAGLNSGEIDQASVGFSNSWAMIEFGRGREIWGPLTEDNLVLSGHLPPWERLVLQASYKHFRYRYTFGFLESINTGGTMPIQRYLVTRGLEYHNNRNLVLGISEVAILAGVNRSIDLAHLNPMALELEIEQNKRENVTDNYTNAVWTIDFDWLPVNDFRLSGSLLLDELKFDDDNDSTYSQIAYMMRAAWTSIRAPICGTFYTKFVHIGTYTFNHVYNYSNFAFRGTVFGDEIGNDAEKFTAGLRIIPNSKVLFEMEYGFLRKGENSLLNENYKQLSHPQSSKFPSGIVQEEWEFNFNILYFFSKNIQLEYLGSFPISDGLNSNLSMLSMRIRYP